MNSRRGFNTSCALILLVSLLATGTMAKSCLWKVTSTDGTLYLQGSVHTLKPDNYPLAPAIENAYTASQVLILETDIGEMSSPETQQRLMSKAMLPGTGSLKQILDEETYQQLSDASTKAGLSMAALDRVKPWFATMTLILTRLQTMGFNPQHGLDYYFYTKAEADGKKVVGLESVEFQIDLFDSLSRENPNDFVKRALSDLELLEEDILSLEKAWETGDIETLGTLISKSFKDYPDLHRTFVVDRNRKWLKTLNTLLKKDQTHMVVVGAGHLSGKEGLLALLQEKGYTLEQL